MEHDPTQAGLSDTYSIGVDPVDHFVHPPYSRNAPHNKIRRWTPRHSSVILDNGNLHLDCPVPSRLLNTLPNKTAREFTHVRYTAATCEPNNFQKERYTLRQALYAQPRSTELFIGITLSNEDEVSLAKTMYGVMENISFLCSRVRSRVWGQLAWQKVVVCILADGRARWFGVPFIADFRLNGRTLLLLEAMGVFQSGVAQSSVQGKPVKAHIFEYSTQVSIDSTLRLQ